MGKSLALLSGAAIFSLVLIFVAPFTFAANIHGTIYDQTLNIKKNVVVEINTLPKQTFVSKTGKYRFNVPLGNYTILARYFGSEGLELEVSKKVYINDYDDYTVDLILFPVNETETIKAPSLGQDNGVGEGNVSLLSLNNSVLILAIFVVLIIIVAVGFVIYRKYWHLLFNKKQSVNEGIEIEHVEDGVDINSVDVGKMVPGADEKINDNDVSVNRDIETVVSVVTDDEKSYMSGKDVDNITEDNENLNEDILNKIDHGHDFEGDAEESSNIKKASEDVTQEGVRDSKSIDFLTLDDELKNVLEIIKANGGRTTQKEIRKQIPLSEAKISLMVAELEHKGFIEKIKKGRGNIIVLKKKF